MTLSMTLSSSITVSETLATSSGDTETFDSFTSESSLFFGSVPEDSSGLALILGGEATALGEDTLAAATMGAVVDSTGLMTTALGSATFLAAAVSPGDEVAFATAYTFGSVTGADWLLMVTNNTQIISQGPEESVAVATSTTVLYGIDFDPVDSNVAIETDPLAAPPVDPLVDPVIESDPFASTAPAIDDQIPIECDCECACHVEDDPEIYIHLDGNVAILDAIAEAFGDDTLAEVASSVLTVEDMLSTISAQVVVAVG